MTKSHSIPRSAKTGQFTVKALGKSKASKFSQVEGITLSRLSDGTLKRLEESGLKGDTLRSAISGTFQKK